MQISAARIRHVPIVSEVTPARVRLATKRDTGVHVTRYKNASISTNALLTPTTVVATQNAATLMAHSNATVTPDSNVALSVRPGLLAQVTSETLKTNLNIFKDVPECANPTLNVCGANTQCVEKVGSYDCVCDPGFERDVWSATSKTCKS